MTEILIRSGKDPFTPVGPESTLAQDVINTNVGNFLFAHTVHKSLSVPGTTIVSNGTLSERKPATPEDHGRINERFDRFVIPLANAFRPEFEHRLANLTTLITGLDIPVTVVGIGAQASVDLDGEPLEAIAPTVKSFVSAVLERSASIGVRGEFTRDYLRGLGFGDTSIDVIGCPSLFLNGRDHRVHKRVETIGADSAIALNVTDGVRGMGEFCERHLDAYPRMNYIAQDSQALTLMLWGKEPATITDRTIPVHMDHPLYREDRMRFFLDMWTWIDHLRTQDFVFGTRFHGNVTALLAGTPAMLLAHDSRTVELAEYHSIPFQPVHDVSSAAMATELYEQTDLTAFNRDMPDRFDTYVRYLERNDLTHIYTPDNENPEFDQLVAAAIFPPPVHPLTSNGREMASRLRWLRDGVSFEADRHSQAYRHPFPHPPRRDPGVVRAEFRSTTNARLRKLEQAQSGAGDQLESQRKELARSKNKIERYQRRLNKQRDRIDRQRDKVAQLESELADSRRSLIYRIARRLKRHRA